ncbi:unnamed protein product [Calicophoron daubneyi]|uniref:Cytochrome c oxidase assembly factor 5 n=1 Tax=Calicophoron daubneyi TaxID=300641 RepID=A0AAV2T817_CALDB
MSRDPRVYPCENVKVELLFCLLKSDCCQKERLTPRECLYSEHFPKECAEAYQTFNRCRLELIDARTRLRGKKYGTNV